MALTKQNIIDLIVELRDNKDGKEFRDMLQKLRMPALRLIYSELLAKEYVK